MFDILSFYFDTGSIYSQEGTLFEKPGRARIVGQFAVATRQNYLQVFRTLNFLNNPKYKKPKELG